LQGFGQSHPFIDAHGLELPHGLVHIHGSWVWLGHGIVCTHGICMDAFVHMFE